MRRALLLFPDTCVEALWWVHAHPTVCGRCDVCVAFQIKVLPLVSNQKWLTEGPEKLVTSKYNWISALYAD